MAKILRIGIISDTHGVVHPRVPELFARMDHIIHAGDIGGPHVLRELESLAPLSYVDGNNDDNTGEDILRFSVDGLRVLLTHILPRPHKPDLRVTQSLNDAPADVVVFGHSHLPHHEVVSGVTYFNPASAGPRRFNYPVSIGMIEKRGRDWKAMHVALDERSIGALEKFMNQMSR